MRPKGPPGRARIIAGRVFFEASSLRGELNQNNLVTQ